MKDKLLNILKDSSKGLTPIEIMDMIKDNSTSEDLHNLIDELDLLCKDGIVRKNKDNAYMINNNVLIGTVDYHEKGNAHVIVEGMEKDIFIRRDWMNNARDKDKVMVVESNDYKGEYRIAKIIKRSLGRSLGEVIDDNGNIYVKSIDKDLSYEIEVENTKNIKLIDGLIVHLDYVKDLSRDKVLACIDYVIGHKNAVGNTTQMAMIGSEFGRRTGFPDEVLNEAKAFSVNEKKEDVDASIKEERKDKRGLTVVTIDSKKTKDIDDGIDNIFLPNGNSLQITAIADVTDKVKFGSAIWKYAEEKGNSDYWGNKVAPMLPIELSNGICSLNPNEDRFTVNVEYELDNAGNIINPNVYTAVIRSKQKMNYDAVQDIIENKDTEDTKDYVTLKYTVLDNESIDEVAFKYAMTREELLLYNKESDFKGGNEVNIPTRKYIKNHYVTAKIMESALKRNGKIDFEGKEPEYEFDENDKVTDIGVRVQRESERIIECKMIYANMAFAQFMVNELSKITSDLVPFVFRTHGSPSPKKIEEFMNMLSAYGIVLPFSVDVNDISNKQVESIIAYLRDKDNFSAFNDKLLRCMQKARYTHENYGHYALGISTYCHYTSPIRRMADLLVHTIFKVFVVEKNHDSKTLKFWGDYLDNVCEKISECEVDSEKCEHAIWDYLNATYMENRIGDIEEAVIDGMFPDSFFARTNKMVDGKVDFFIDESDSRELLKLTDKEEIIAFVEKHKKVFGGFYDYNEKLFGYSKNGRMCLRYGDKVRVCCVCADPDRRRIDFVLVGKI